MNTILYHYAILNKQIHSQVQTNSTVITIIIITDDDFDMT